MQFKKSEVGSEGGWICATANAWTAVMHEKAKTATQFSSPIFRRTLRNSKSARLYWFDACTTKFEFVPGVKVARWSAEMLRIPRRRNGCSNPI